LPRPLLRGLPGRQFEQHGRAPGCREVNATHGWSVWQNAVAFRTGRSTDTSDSPQSAGQNLGFSLAAPAVRRRSVRYCLLAARFVGRAITSTWRLGITLLMLGVTPFNRGRTNARLLPGIARGAVFPALAKPARTARSRHREGCKGPAGDVRQRSTILRTACTRAIRPSTEASALVLIRDPQIWKT
jgi:hypothetical protein